MSLTEFRQWCYDLCAAYVDLPVYLWLPGNAEELPCYVVGRPDMDEDTPRSVQKVSIPVYALGRTLRDDDAQAELDRMADNLVNLYWKPPLQPGVSLRMTRIRATVLTIAAIEVPAYTATLIGAVQPCP